MSRPKNNILGINLSGLAVKFYVKNPDELRLVESVTGDEGEKKVIESLISFLKYGDVVYDIGANIGVYSAILAKAIGSNGKIIAFEPEKRSMVRLKENIKLNKLDNIIVINKALGEEAGTLKLYIGETTGNFSLVNIYDKKTESEIVEIVKGDDFIRQQNLPTANVVKIDVEGYEYSVLKGLEKTLANPDCRTICCEIHIGLLPDRVTEEKIIELIKSFGFQKLNTFKRGFSAYHIIAEKNEK